jgi:hydroxymethylpyrimidine kinase/phosphomethylpyrimidine kinase
MRIALSIAGSDPTGGAGLQADLQVFRAFGLHGAGVVSALTIQDSAKVHRTLPVFPTLVRDQIRVLLADLPPAAVKIGMLATDDVTLNVIFGLVSLDPATPVVIDPVLQASDGTALLERRAIPNLTELMRERTLVTPNLPEAETLTSRDVSTAEGCEAAARTFIEEIGARGVLIKGGHRGGAPDDLLAWASDAGPVFRWQKGERVDSGPVHGTGCALSSAIAAGLALGRDLETAVTDARSFVVAGIRAAQQLGSGAAFLSHATVEGT